MYTHTRCHSLPRRTSCSPHGDDEHGQRVRVLSVERWNRLSRVAWVGSCSVSVAGGNGLSAPLLASVHPGKPALRFSAPLRWPARVGRAVDGARSHHARLCAPPQLPGGAHRSLARAPSLPAAGHRPDPGSVCQWLSATSPRATRRVPLPRHVAVSGRGHASDRGCHQCSLQGQRTTAVRGSAAHSHRRHAGADRSWRCLGSLFRGPARPSRAGAGSPGSRHLLEAGRGTGRWPLPDHALSQKLPGTERASARAHCRRRHRAGGRRIPFHTDGTTADANRRHRLIPIGPDPDLAPALALCLLSHERWDRERWRDERKNHRCLSHHPLRSPLLIVQEASAMLLTHAAIRVLLCEAAQAHGALDQRDHYRALSARCHHPLASAPGRQPADPALPDVCLPGRSCFAARVASSALHVSGRHTHLHAIPPHTPGASEAPPHTYLLCRHSPSVTGIVP
jgi:hypothetical protein